MKIEAQDFLRLAENAGTIGVVDIESIGFKGDYGSILCVSIKRLGQDPVSFAVKQVGNDQRVVRQSKEVLEGLDCWVGQYSKNFDIPMLNARLFKWGIPPLEPKPHIDLYWLLKSGRYRMLLSSRGLAHVARWLEIAEQKMGVSPDVWARIAANPRKEMPEMIARCESDTIATEQVFNELKHLIVDINR